MSGFHLAQINIGRLLAPVDHPKLADFVANLDRINALADGQPGFVWRLTGEGGDATDIRPVEDDPMVAINMSVWTDLDALAAFVYRTAHREVMRRRREWFEGMETYMTLWWVPLGHRPTPAEGMARLAILERLGPGPEAFTFRNPFPAPDASSVAPILDECA
ncbi:DUF3291 domain-containing protein [Phenylobacterium sp.]|jgi:heme-degrading monooxygenase HmoA|uniref:DUF3291 domain-containing protein n=1 Tax=Phenylobacterium sp. TaxID=1871053 RepID=UPI002F41F231